MLRITGLCRECIPSKLKGCTVNIDAMGYPKDIVQGIDNELHWALDLAYREDGLCQNGERPGDWCHPALHQAEHAPTEPEHETEHPAPQAQSGPLAGILFGDHAWFSMGNVRCLIPQINHVFTLNSQLHPHLF